ncbi:MAG: M64 family metallopeptidase [Prevotella sp.]|nr:M64 family metallopeptidase [Prevotella sp.]
MTVKCTMRDSLHKLCSVAMMLCMFLLASCTKEDDFSVSNGGVESSSGYQGYKKLLTHTEGKGFVIAIMADGYTQSEINSGEYDEAVNSAVDALFSGEPMASLKPYFDVYNIVLSSAESGITTKKKDTALGTRFKSTSDVEVYGDSLKVWQLAGVVAASSGVQLTNTLAVVLLNSDQYAGVTLMTVPSESTDSIPSGFALAYVPVGCKIGNVSYFKDVLQHEAVGHGIAKLQDEYFQEYGTPSDDYVSNFKKYQKNGYYLNVIYDTDADDDYNGYYYSASYNSRTYKVLFGLHPFEPGDIGYEFTQNSAYDSEELNWYQGGATYLTIGSRYTGDNYFGVYYTAEKNFYRPTVYSLMNSVVTGSKYGFNALSRYAIYARVMKAVTGSSENIHSQALYQQFMAIDKPASVSSGAKAVNGQMSATDCVTSVVAEEDVPRLIAPKIVDFGEGK